MKRLFTKLNNEGLTFRHESNGLSAKQKFILWLSAIMGAVLIAVLYFGGFLAFIFCGCIAVAGMALCESI